MDVLSPPEKKVPTYTLRDKVSSTSSSFPNNNLRDDDFDDNFVIIIIIIIIDFCSFVRLLFVVVVVGGGGGGVYKSPTKVLCMYVVLLGKNIRRWCCVVSRWSKTHSVVCK